MVRKILFPLTIFLASSFFGIFLTSDDNGRGQTTEPPEEERADYFLSGFEIRYHDASGEVRAILRGEHGEHFPHSQEIKIERPRWRAESNQGAVWLASSPHGIFRRDTEILLLQEEVEINRRADAQHSALDIATRQLKIDTATGQARTRSQVRITDPWGFAQGVGMTLDYNHDRVKLHNRAKGRYEIEPTD